MISLISPIVRKIIFYVGIALVLIPHGVWAQVYSQPLISEFSDVDISSESLHYADLRIGNQLNNNKYIDKITMYIKIASTTLSNTMSIKLECFTNAGLATLCSGVNTITGTTTFLNPTIGEIKQVTFNMYPKTMLSSDTKYYRLTTNYVTGDIGIKLGIFSGLSCYTWTTPISDYQTTCPYLIISGTASDDQYISTYTGITTIQDVDLGSATSGQLNIDQESASMINTLRELMGITSTTSAESPLDKVGLGIWDSIKQVSYSIMPVQYLFEGENIINKFKDGYNSTSTGDAIWNYSSGTASTSLIIIDSSAVQAIPLVAKIREIETYIMYFIFSLLIPFSAFKIFK